MNAAQPGRLENDGTMSPGDVVRLIREGYDHRAWHGPNLRSSLHGVKADEAAWRPGPDRHCIWEIALHCAYWKHRVLARTAGLRERFPRSPANFPRLPASPDDVAWRTDQALLDSVHARLLEYVEQMDEDQLDDVPAGRTQPNRAHLIGIAFHDVYHAGQIRLLRRLYAERPAPRAGGRGSGRSGSGRSGRRSGSG